MEDKVSIVSVTYRSPEETRSFVESVYANTHGPYEFIMCANGVKDAALLSYLRTQEAKGRMRVVWNPRNIGVRAFNQVIKLATTPYVFRCDSDIEINDPYWTKLMLSQLRVSQSEIGPVVAVGTANTRGHRIQRTPNTVETDMIMSNCMLIHRQTAKAIEDKLIMEYPRMADEALLLKRGNHGYQGFPGDLDAMLDYARFHSTGLWDLNFGGVEEEIGYGSDDMWWSLLARWAGLKLVTSNAGVVHKDASGRPGYEAERHRLVARGFQYMRTSLSLAMSEWRQEAWTGLPNNLPVLVKYRESGEAVSI